MRAEAVSWDEWSVGNPPPSADTDKWHVQIAQDEVKVLSLEQLDDLYRLSIVDSETQVWQTGMTEWQPLRVIAGLDEEPAPPARRAPPKPPTRTVVMPPPMLNKTQPMPVRSVAPAPHSASPSVRPSAPIARPVSVAPASFYPEPIQATPSAYNQPVAYAAPVAFAATLPAPQSVRPLVVTRPPPAARRGGGFGRFLVALALVAGIGVTAYRNDFVREAAHSAHQDALFARLETALGGPAFGTLRALEQSAAALPASALGANIAAPLHSLDTSASDSTAAPKAAAPALGTTTPPVVSLESLTPEQKGQPTKSPAVAPPAAAAAAPPVAHATASLQPKPEPAPARPAPVRASAPLAARAPAAPKPAPAKREPALEKPAPVAQKPASEMTDRERLNAAIGQSMLESSTKAKKKPASKGNEYDPLNPNL